MSDQRGPAGSPPTDPAEPLDPDRSLSELVSSLGNDVSQLLSTQVELAKVEIKEEVARAAKGAGLLSGGAVGAFIAILFLSHAAAWGLAAVMPDGFAYLIVGLVWAAIAAVLALNGRTKLQQTDPLPHGAIDELQSDRDLARDQLGR